jgi:hypothetical protein
VRPNPLGIHPTGLRLLPSPCAAPSTTIQLSYSLISVLDFRFFFHFSISIFILSVATSVFNFSW